NVWWRAMVPVPNSTAVTWPEPERSPCMVGIFPVVYYSILLGLGLPVNILTAVALSRLATRTKKSSYWYLLALTTSDILTQLFIIFVGFILQTAILARAVPRAFIHIVNVLEFAANHASIWVTVLLTVDRYVALCHPLRYRTVSYPRRTRRIIAAVFAVALATGIPFYWWLDAWRDADPPTVLDRVLKWVHCVTIYFLPCSIFLATNSVIIHKLKQRRRSGSCRPLRGKTTALLLAVTTVFIVLWAPRTAVMMCHLYVASVKRDWRVHLALDIANMVAMLNTTLNFFLYCFVSETFRRAVSEVLCAHTVPGAPLSARLLCRMGAAVPASACILLALLPMGRAQSTPPSGCSQDLSSLYYNLCDLSAAWGIVLEAAASLGAVTSFVLTIVLVASLPFMQDPQKKSLVATQAFFLLGTFGLFCLTFDFIVGPDFSTCTSRRFLFGVLFAICFSCLLAHAVALNFLARRNRGPRGWVTLAVALLLALVEVIINAEWLIITVARQEGGPVDPCGLEDADFVMALTYVMVLLVAAFGTAWPTLCGRYTRWRKHGAFILATSGLSMAIWVTWMAMYLYGNQRVGKKPGWDDPTLAIALVSNAYAFVLLYVIPEVTHVTRHASEQGYEDDVYPTRGVGYETILKEQKSQSMFVENKAFSMDEPSFAKKPVSPYSGYNGQLLTSVYQPTEMALMHKGTSEGPYDVILPRATAASSASSTLRAEDAFAVQARHAAAQRDARGSQVKFLMQAGVGMVLGGDVLLLVLPSAILLCLQVLSPYSRNRW
ncbi:UNVERIFIED_CONTAM: hypothetical protein H355_015719, partial [Colinus virginianus]